jgi:hypothetical protein
MNNKKPLLEDNVKGRLLVSYFRSIYDNYIPRFDILNRQIEDLVKLNTALDNVILKDAILERYNTLSEIDSLRKKLESVLFDNKRHENAKTVRKIKAFAGKL